MRSWLTRMMVTTMTTTTKLIIRCAHTHTLLILWLSSYCTHTLAMCTHTLLILYSYSTHTVLILYSYCTHTLLTLYSYSILILYSYSTHTLLILYSAGGEQSGPYLHGKC
jgi:hypothetical protein